MSAPLTVRKLDAVQAALGTLTSTSCDFGMFPAFDGTQRYSCSARQPDGSLRYGSGTSLAAAYTEAMTREPIPAKKDLAA